jgi:hypothetical protein
MRIMMRIMTDSASETRQLSLIFWVQWVEVVPIGKMVKDLD